MTLEKVTLLLLLSAPAAAEPDARFAALLELGRSAPVVERTLTSETRELRREGRTLTRIVNFALGVRTDELIRLERVVASATAHPDARCGLGCKEIVLLGANGRVSRPLWVMNLAGIHYVLSAPPFGPAQTGYAELGREEAAALRERELTFWTGQAP